MIDNLQILFKEKIEIETKETLNGNKFYHLNVGPYNIGLIDVDEKLSLNKFVPSKIFKNDFYSEAFASVAMAMSEDIK